MTRPTAEIVADLRSNAMKANGYNGSRMLEAADRLSELDAEVDWLKMNFDIYMHNTNAQLAAIIIALDHWENVEITDNEFAAILAMAVGR